MKKLGIVLALSLTVILALTGCSNSSVDKAVNNAKAFADQKNFGQAAMTVHSAEKELGSNLGPKELKALANAYSYIVVKIADNAKTEGENGNFDKAFANINSSNQIISLPPSMNLSPESIEAANSARKEIAKKCLKAALENKNLGASVKLFNTASSGVNTSITPEIQKIFDDTRIKITEGPAISIIKVFDDNNITSAQDAITNAEGTMRIIDSMNTSISSAQSDKIVEARDILLTKKTQADIDIRLAQAEPYPYAQRPDNSLEIVSLKTYKTIANIYNDPVYRKSITEKQKQRYNAIAILVNNKINKKVKDDTGQLPPLPANTYWQQQFGQYIVPIFPLQ